MKKSRKQVDLEIDRKRARAILHILGLGKVVGSSSMTATRKRWLIKQLRLWRDADIETAISDHFALDEQELLERY